MNARRAEYDLNRCCRRNISRFIYFPIEWHQYLQEIMYVTVVKIVLKNKTDMWQKVWTFKTKDSQNID